MLDDRQCVESPRTENFGIGRNRTPAQTFQTAFLRLRFDSIASCLFLTRRQKDHSQPKHPGQLDAKFSSTLTNQFVRDTREQTGAVTASAIGVHTSAMRQPDQGFERAVHDLPRSGSADPGDQADTAGVVVCG